ncbi:hypothetical protein B9Z55_025504 [Caenorhabditis nigoni]|uniref:Uncharacterized protein n=1 Tax=Caenorhabditis nigoni TaxID=1611254 RepID=A0A2G5SZ33_9PELO|nr:hypothetical protein B9Z55_025504 [Caenorhabditis nigoni]
MPQMLLSRKQYQMTHHGFHVFLPYTMYSHIPFLNQELTPHSYSTLDMFSLMRKYRTAPATMGRFHPLVMTLVIYALSDVAFSGAVGVSAYQVKVLYIIHIIKNKWSISDLNYLDSCKIYQKFVN